jgi:hypothetical protein
MQESIVQNRRHCERSEHLDAAYSPSPFGEGVGG